VSTYDWLMLIWLAGAVVFGIGQAIENQRVFHVFGPPSALAVGLFWPITAAVLLIWLIVLGLRALFSHPKDHHHAD
jgi:hypothetical protein